MLHKLKANTWL